MNRDSGLERPRRSITVRSIPLLWLCRKFWTVVWDLEETPQTTGCTVLLDDWFVKREKVMFASGFARRVLAIPVEGFQVQLQERWICGWIRAMQKLQVFQIEENGRRKHGDWKTLIKVIKIGHARFLIDYGRSRRFGKLSQAHLRLVRLWIVANQSLPLDGGHWMPWPMWNCILKRCLASHAAQPPFTGDNTSQTRHPRLWISCELQ